MLTVRLRAQVAEWADDQPRAELSRLPIPVRDHQPRGVALSTDSLSASGMSKTCWPSGALRSPTRTIRQWCLTFGPNYARTLRRRRGRMGDTWHLDELFVTLKGRQRYLWRAVDEDGDVLDILVQSRRNRRAAARFFSKISYRPLKGRFDEGPSKGPAVS